jgi:hypothetical protein
MSMSFIVLAACQEKSMIVNPVSDQQDVNGQYQVVSQYALAPSIDSYYPLQNGNNVEAGFVHVYNDQSYIYVSYFMNDGWQLDSACVKVGNSVNESPLNIQAAPGGAICNKMDPNRGGYAQKLSIAQLGYQMNDLVVIVTQADVNKVASNGEVVGKEVFWAGDLNGAGSEWSHYLMYKLHLDPKQIENIGNIQDNGIPEGDVNL